MTPATKEKRAQFLAFMKKVLLPKTAVQGIIGIGSIANGRMRPDSDIDIFSFSIRTTFTSCPPKHTGWRQTIVFTASSATMKPFSKGFYAV